MAPNKGFTLPCEASDHMHRIVFTEADITGDSEVRLATAPYGCPQTRGPGTYGGGK